MEITEFLVFPAAPTLVKAGAGTEYKRPERDTGVHGKTRKGEGSVTVQSPLYLEDFSPGQTFASGSMTVHADAIKAYARQFDPQPFHLDETAAADTFFRGLAASGWHTASVTMRLLAEGGLPIAGGVIGAGVDELRWPRATRPGDTLRLVSEVLEVRASKSRPEQGLMRVRTTTLNQNDEPVLVMVSNLVVPRRAG
jgi:acyl dehydratase